MDQGILRFTWYSLVLVAKGYALALLIGTPMGFLLGLSKTVHQELRSDHPDPAAGLAAGLAAAGIGAVLEQVRTRRAGALFTIAICAMWPTVLNTAVGVRRSRRIT